MTTVTVVDYGLGNLHSVTKALRHVGADVQLTGNPEAVRQAERLVVPGVGAFADGMAALRRQGLDEAVREVAANGRPLLGICLGMQLLFAESEEFGTHAGLGILPGRVRAIRPPQPVKVPHMGWNAIVPPAGASWEGSVLAATRPGTRLYFVHSYAAVPETGLLAVAEYGGSFITAAVRCHNVYGVQFHPEKSGPAGLALLAQFIALQASP